MTQQSEPVRYAVVGLGHIAQVAVLPAFEHAANSELAALVSGSSTKREELSERHGVARATDYEGYDELLESGAVEAVYIALPNHLHREYAVRAAERGVHVLCEKPMAVTEEECRAMIEACREGGVRLMVAYRLHFEEANMEVAGVVRSGAIGEPRFMESAFGLTVAEDDIRLVPVEEGGGPVHDLGVYCINGARYVFRDEPVEVMARSASRKDPRFERTPETVSAVLRFPDERIASFTCSFGSADVEAYRVVGTEGEVRVDPAYGYVSSLAYEVRTGDDIRRKEFPKRDQFAPELIHFSNCVRQGIDPEPDGNEGMADVRVVEAIHESVRTGRAVALEPVEPQKRPGPEQVRTRPGVEKPEEVQVSGPHEGD